ncbi:hypothetical protein JL720_13302 [Aureococcus anophagefferens]|nr:hypothetical protein JL720_13302 [Aureococcus anophagefferens]
MLREALLDLHRAADMDGSYDVRAHVFSKRRSEKVALRESHDCVWAQARARPFGAGLERKCNDLLMGGRPFCSGAQGGAFAAPLAELMGARCGGAAGADGAWTFGSLPYALNVRDAFERGSDGSLDCSVPVFGPLLVLHQKRYLKTGPSRSSLASSRASAAPSTRPSRPAATSGSAGAATATPPRGPATG